VCFARKTLRVPASAMLSATDSARHRVLGPVEFAITRSGLAATVRRVSAVVEPSVQVKVGIGAAGHYHRPVLDYRWPTGWEVLQLNPGHVAEQRRVAVGGGSRPMRSTWRRSPSWCWPGKVR
jgi:hypothetical protein